MQQLPNVPSCHIKEKQGGSVLDGCAVVYEAQSGLFLRLFHIASRQRV